MKAGVTTTELRELMGFLGRYATAHFRYEEACMRRVDCPVAQANLAAHRHFEAVFHEIAREIEANGPRTTLILRVQRELADWIRDHIITCDTQLREYADEVA